MCEMHYVRVRRNGSPERTKPAYRYRTSGSYTTLFRPEHPLANSGGYVFERREVLWGELGAERTPACIWCDIELDWSTLVVDHLDENKQNNAPNNLVASCNRCNRSRGALLPFLRGLQPGSVELFLRLAREQTTQATLA